MVYVAIFDIEVFDEPQIAILPSPDTTVFLACPTGCSLAPENLLRFGERLSVCLLLRVPSCHPGVIWANDRRTILGGWSERPSRVVSAADNSIKDASIFLQTSDGDIMVT